ncbi:MAG: tetratricopeptide repeat protein [Nitrospirota bacterium]
MNLQEALQAVSENLTAGNLEKSESLCREILQKWPDNEEVLAMIGGLYSQSRHYALATHFLKQAISVNPRNTALYHELGCIYEEENSLDEAIACYHTALQLDPDDADAYFNLGVLYQKKGETDKAISAFEQAINLSPDDADAHFNLGNLFRKNAAFDLALSHYQKSIALNPKHFLSLNNIGTLYLEQKNIREAIRSYRLALACNPDFPETYSNLGNAYQLAEQLDKAEACYKKALQLNPNSAEVYNNLGNIFQVRGELPDAVNCYGKALQISPLPACLSNLLFVSNYQPHSNGAELFRQHCRYAQYFSALSSKAVSYQNERTVNRPLRIGYISPDFRKHSVAYFIEPVLMHHDPERCTVFCYSDVASPDGVTDRIKSLPIQWRTISGMSDEQACGLIQKERIDILIDLAGHTSDNRMALFARKPSPVQASWIGYPATTGIPAIDYKIVDAYTDPPGMTEPFYVEKLIRMPDCFLCYLPEKPCPEITPLPLIEAGKITFGSFNNFNKITSEILDVWTAILKKIPDSRLLVKAKSLSLENCRKSIMNMFAQEGIASERITLCAWVPSVYEHLKLYSSIDIALDTYPYNGTTTTCEALWMGVPVITLEGNTHASRVGVSLLSNIGVPELIAKTKEEYLERACDLSADVSRLQLYREHLRDRISHSALTDAGQFVSALEQRYRLMWETWCKSADRSGDA